MKTVVFLLVAVAAMSQAIPHQSLKTEWQNFKTKHAKTYSNSIEENLRKNIFIANHKKIAEHNAKFEKGLVTYKLGINQFADMLPEEFAMKYTGVKMTPEIIQSYRNRSTATFLAPANVELPKSVDWRKQGAVTPVKDQGQCGSCWAFSTTGALEGQHFRKTGKLVSLSEQQLVDCTEPYGNHGCGGGLMTPSFEYIKDNKGIDTEESYPYEADEGECRFDSKTVGATDAGFVEINEDDEDDLKAAVATIGPVAVAIHASNSFQFYDSGFFYDPSCENQYPNHAVLVVGYGTDKQGQDYWIVKNSWSTSWGDAGYIKMARNMDNNCFIASVASYPTV